MKLTIMDKIFSKSNDINSNNDYLDAILNDSDEDNKSNDLNKIKDKDVIDQLYFF